MSSYQLDWKGDKIADAIRKETKASLLKAAEDLKKESSAQAPIDKGDLRADCAIDSSKLDSDLTIAIGYSLDYAMEQHENLDFNHPKGGKAKFLEDPFNENVGKYKEMILNGVKKVIK